MVTITGAITPNVELLKEIELFEPFNEQELQLLLTMGQGMRFESYANIVVEGEMSWGLYIILEGLCGVFKHNEMTESTTYDIGQLAQGSFFGEMSLVDEGGRSATVRALSDCQLLYISKEQFNQFLAQAPDRQTRFLNSCVRTLVARLRELDDSYVISQYQLWKTALQKKDAA